MSPFCFLFYFHWQSQKQNIDINRQAKFAATPSLALFVNLKNVVCKIGEDAEVLMSLYDPVESKFIRSVRSPCLSSLVTAGNMASESPQSLALAGSPWGDQLARLPPSSWSLGQDQLSGKDVDIRLNSWSLVMFSKPGNCMTKDWSHASCVVFMGCFVYGPPPSLQYCSDLDVAFLSFGSLWVSFLDLWPVVFSPRWLDGKQCLGRCLLHKGCQWICVE